MMLLILGAAMPMPNHEPTPVSPESEPVRMGVRLEDIDIEALLTFVSIYFEESGRNFDTQEGFDKTVSSAIAEMNMTEYDDNWNVTGVKAIPGEFRFGSVFSLHSKLWFRNCYRLTSPTVWIDFDHNMSNPPEEFYEAQERFNDRVDGYLAERGIAIPLYSL